MASNQSYNFHIFYYLTEITAKRQHNAIDPSKEVVLKRVAEMMRGKMDISNLLSRVQSKGFNRYLIKSSIINHNAVYSLSNSSWYFILRRINTLIVIIQSNSSGLNDQEVDTQAEEFFQLLSAVTEKEDLKVSCLNAVIRCHHLQ